jgi:2'-5' RNA ligase
MSKTALDIVLLPPLDLWAECVRLNASLSNTEAISFAEGSKQVPHITLSMAASNDTGIPNQIGEIIAQLTAFPPLRLVVKGIESYTNAEGEIINWLTFEPNPMLKMLHAKAVGIFPSSETENFGTSAFAGEGIRDSDLSYLRYFQEQHALENYQPHITLGVGSGITATEWVGKAVWFTDIAIYQLGRYCSCMEEIHTFGLEGS